MKAIDVMSAPAVVVFPDMTIKEAASILTGHRISGAPVVDRASGRLVGMLSEGDLLRADRRAAGGATGVAEVMASNAIAVDQNTDIREVATRLIEANVHRVPVMGADAVVGVVSRHDLLSTCAGVTPPSRSRSRTS